MAPQTRTCEKCKQQVTLDKVRLMPRDKDKTWLLCQECAQKMMPGKPQKKEQTMTPKLDTSIKRLSILKESKKDTRETYYCKRCSYSFSVNLEKVLNEIRCPYCGNSDQIVQKG